MPPDWTADDIETDKKRFQAISHSGWDRYLFGNRECQIKFPLFEMITSGRTKWPGFLMGGGEIEHRGERDSLRARNIVWVHAEGIDSAEGKSLICLPDKSLCLLSLDVIERG